MQSSSAAIFTCEQCGKQVQTTWRKGNSIVPWFRKLNVNLDGSCKSCNNPVWTLTLVHTQTGMDETASAIGMGLAVTTGIGFTQSSTAVSTTSYAGITGEFLKVINEDPASAMSLITQLAHKLEREQLKDRGAKECIGCGAMYVVEPGKPWTDLGYCAKMCAIGHGEKSFVGALKTTAAAPIKSSASVAVACSKGHEFSVANTFRGLKRPCPQCGEKVAVP
jgi:hypothetical protein